MKHHAIEHTPVYDLDAHHQRQRKRQRRTLIRNIIETVTYSAVLALSFQIMIMGAPV